MRRDEIGRVVVCLEVMRIMLRWRLGVDGTNAVDAENTERASKVHCGIFMAARFCFDDYLLQCASFVCDVIKSDFLICGHVWWQRINS